MARRCVLVLMVLVAAMPLWADGACSQEAIKQAAARARKAQSALLAVKISTQLGNDVTPVMQKLIREFKDKLAATADAQVACVEADVDATSLERKLGVALGANKPEKPFVPEEPGGPTEVDRVYGDDVHLRVRRMQNYPQLLTVDIDFSIECGLDSVLLVYERASNDWRRVVRWQSGDYNETNGAFGDLFEYVVVSRGTPEEWAIAAVHGHPWCTSRWSGYDLEVIAPAKGDQAQRTFFHTRHGYIRGDVGATLKATADGFQLRLEVGSLDMDTMTRLGVYRYRVDGDKVERIQPIAVNGRGFVDEWLQVAWADASRWSDPQKLEQLKAEHERLGHAPGANHEKSISLSYGPVRTCSEDRNHYQVQENEEPGNPLYFQIKQVDNGYMMMSISPKADPSCKGRDIMPKQQ